MANLLKSTPLIISILFFLEFSIINGHGDENHDSGGATDLHKKGLILVKVWCLIILFASTFAGGVSPYFYRWNENFLLLGTQFAGGVFLGTSLIHFLSDSASTFGELTTKSYPFAFMLASAGYLLTMLGDCIILLVMKSVEKSEAKVDVEEGHARELGTGLNPAFVRTSSLGDTILLILALCFHSVFEGIAVGVSGVCWNSSFFVSFFNRGVIAVADGVSGWAGKNVDPAKN
ncbi:hypothetical protein RJ639_014175 [Escallonia herrerae]|uniref:Uncharacterized protein n=1 Tax=Escallonia herrerae TaxID=1293975 RepID=A0AA89AP67_9ASTE|nr:hypothetical protein RJ639_014175 [Escallonia herrerae]